MKGSKVFTTGQVADLCHVAPRTVSKWFDAGRLKGYRIPGSNDRRIPREALIEFMREHGIPTADLEAATTFAAVLIGAEGPVVARLRELLPEGDGNRLSFAASAFAAGAMVAGLRPQAVVIDLGVGRADGCAIAASLRREESLAGLALVALASEDETDPEGLTAAGFDAVLKKPVDPLAVAQALTDAAARREHEGPKAYSARKSLAARSGRTPPLRLASPQP